MAAGVLGAALMLLILGYPVMKLEAVSRQYQLYGSYVYVPGETAAPDTKFVKMNTRSADYRGKGIKLTNVLYYPGLRQLAFGYIYGNDGQEKYEIALVDADGRNVPGRLLVSGHERFYAKQLQKLNFMLEEPLGRQTGYTLLVTNEQGERVGALDFYHD
jgi:hypothetical protein